ncbi:unnamed protein product [Cylicostephanus goldi]|uniref:Uncharacterized protein n=1 Tax=Cylicostephanus goldi TaxID=71465 RepID=A0A3P6R9I7_CYLGO|nr:unnamed protein product [Cylicostephanus goldi]
MNRVSVPGSPRSHYSPRLLNGHAEPMQERHQRFSDPDPLDTVSRTARVPPPKIYPTGVVRRTESFNSAPGVLAVRFKSFYYNVFIVCIFFLFGYFYHPFLHHF